MRLAPPAAADQAPAAVTTLPDRYLEPVELGSLVRDLAAEAHVAAVASSIQPVDGARDWRMLYRDANVDIWIIVWAGGADTGWHDHDRSAGAFHVLGGRVVESRPTLDGSHQQRRFDAGHGAAFGPDHVHRVTADADRSMTVHAYSPPLSRMGRYSVDAEGALRRQSLGYDGELEIG